MNQAFVTPKQEKLAQQHTRQHTQAQPSLNKTQRRKISEFRNLGIQICVGLMVVGCVIGLIFFARPATSNLENRSLTPFPQLSAETFLNGEFFTELSLWYADTYPLREPMVSAGQSIKNLYGVQPKEAFYGGNRQSDELPVVGENEEAGEVEKAGVAQRNKDAAPPNMQLAAENLEAQITNGVYSTEGAGYTLYYFSEDACEEYCGIVNEAAEKLDGIASVYSVILPTNAGVLLDASLQKELGAANQEQAIDYFYSRLSDKVIPIETFDPLYEHKDEYLYFRTDHHWTQLGAYYVYQNFCQAKGIPIPNYSAWEEQVFEPFLGSYYAEVGIADLYDNADSVVARTPQGTNEMYYWVDDLIDGGEMQGYVISDLSDANPTLKYQCFASGNFSLSCIKNPTITDGSSCLIIKDSFGNPFTTMFVDSYEYVYTFDFRYTSQDLVSFVKAHHIQDVIIENCVMFAGTYDAAGLVGMIVDGSNAKIAGSGPSMPFDESDAAARANAMQVEGSAEATNEEDEIATA